MGSHLQDCIGGLSPEAFAEIIGLEESGVITRAGAYEVMKELLFGPVTLSFRDGSMMDNEENRIWLKKVETAINKRLEELKEA